MRKIFVGIFAGMLMLGVLVSCKDKLEEQYFNPEKTTEASIGKFFTFMLDNSRVRPEYWNVRTFLAMHPAVYTQAVSFMNTSKRYQQQVNYLDDYWRDYYTPTAGGVVAHLREIEKAYAGLSAEEKANADVFVHAAKVVYYDQTAQMVDLWGDIPFSEAGSLNLSGATTSPKFDNAEEIYAAILTGLEEAAAYFESANLDPLVASSFTKQDILLQGNLNKWRRYANSLRLRALMRISFQNESKAKADVLEMLSAPASYPLIEDAAFNILLSPQTTYNDNLRNAVTELNSYIAPEHLLDGVLKPANDPRLRSLFDKNTTDQGVHNADYFAMPVTLNSAAQEENIGDGKYAILDSATFLFNTKFPGIVFTSSETAFLKAEAFERWGSTTDAEAAYLKGVTDAVKFTFYLNTLGAGKEAPVTADEISDLLASAEVAYTGTTTEKQIKIWTQKWVDFGLIQSVQGWSELRRTKYPVLTFLSDGSAVDFQLPGSRLVYPPNEKTFNAVNYAKVADKDKPSTKIFWDVK
ncbi:SusD/RagB family nutrient-binding outer membrane lipoprotein [Chryseolinea lacunae]|uniref:SusD/RagB family nutrient-binding outer membrane lipoprotein n=1 Tax=Chryseolinea lacunae TaxID=2801331 RepID=A0ABS1KNV9_9BACT|nr:SusD/RagB family nutrient-binding outer membrane lipoprotein [Chryseolinea lacunae]MBL0741116.1 SusD/RagB family nutrient-binding outer membrane lipoprotein [Chryseolinea lacunae]